MNEVLKPYSGLSGRENFMGRNSSIHEMDGRNLKPYENVPRDKI
jgi:hypothetical protein